VFADTSEDIEGAGNFTHLNSNVPTFAGYHTIIARLIDDSDYSFVAYFLDSTTYRTQIQNLVKGVKVYSITNKILKDTILFFPPEDEQKAIAQFIDEKVNKIFASREKLEQSIKKLKEYRQSIISEAVTGKIDVRDWQPKTA
jgi:type I restriction enzyme S subunit